MERLRRAKPKSKEKWTFVNKKREEKKHQTEWSATTNKHRCMRCGMVKVALVRTRHGEESR